jgi:hypothetical protein
MDPFEAFESKAAGEENDPAAEFLAREQAELAKIENNDFANDFSNFGLYFNHFENTHLTISD